MQKTGRVYRTVDLLDALRGDLAPWIKTSGRGAPNDRLFARKDGELLKVDDWDNWRNRRFYDVLDDLGIARRRPYDLRHSFVSLLIREGETSIVELAEQLGHSPTETLKTYAHVFSEFRRQPRVPASRLIAEARGSRTHDNRSVAFTRKQKRASGPSRQPSSGLVTDPAFSDRSCWTA